MKPYIPQPNPSDEPIVEFYQARCDNLHEDIAPADLPMEWTGTKRNDQTMAEKDVVEHNLRYKGHKAYVISWPLLPKFQTQ